MNIQGNGRESVNIFSSQSQRASARRRTIVVETLLVVLLFFAKKINHQDRTTLSTLPETCLVFFNTNLHQTMWWCNITWKSRFPCSKTNILFGHHSYVSTKTRILISVCHPNQPLALKKQSSFEGIIHLQFKKWMFIWFKLVLQFCGIWKNDIFFDVWRFGSKNQLLKRVTDMNE